MKRVSFFLATALTTGILLSSAGSFAQQAKPDLKLATESDAGSLEMVAEARSPLQAWQDWLGNAGLYEGENTAPDGRAFYITAATAEVRGEPGSAKWVTARRAAFNAALLQAKKNLAETVAVTLQSSRGFELITQGGDEVPPMMQEAASTVSLMEKMTKLANEALDSEIRKYDPEWTGEGVSEEQKQQKVFALQERYREYLASQAQLFLQGAMPIANFEGPNLDGKYGVLVGIVWSPRMARLAEALYNPDVTPDVGAPAPRLSEQIRGMLAADPNALAVAQGVRVWNNEFGEAAVVSFAPVGRTSSSAVNNSRAALIGRSQIAQFVAEAVTVNTQSQGGVTFREYQDGQNEVFDDTKFAEIVNAEAKRMQLQGVVKVHSWTGFHPYEKTPLQVDVYAWTPSSRAMSQRLGTMADKNQNLFEGRNSSGAVQGQASQPTAAPVRSGPSSNPTRF